ncbi:hypothetical protein GCM10008959_28820 [Deinococcus seoulensis]|uniref:Uncharacterized protein n=1 Tax=Deinococcus seoulensis TaxID=1837379 RepID=A0ABQ2RW71_9DEIO|nr:MULTISPECIES: hypothetical protein [Deinococcus]MBX8464770.1 hypothetical protein [Deinococcus sp. RIT780]GGR64907.1 hypothetical protein GCM10008959_28820 [Deinococcus seoulensis]GHG38076.1 hypothetical protein GCM10017784_35800 [Deinococcus indicus]
MPPLVYVRLPHRLRARHVRIVECLLDMNRAGHRDAVWQCIKLCQDVREHGHVSRYVVALKGYPGISELKPSTRTGERGGARVYLFWLADGRPVLVNAEFKADGDGPNEALIEEAYDALIAVKTGRLKV